jgi:membrane-associated protease RseP (regulator of RpoE activity)
MTEAESTRDSRNNGWKWATIVIGGLFLISCMCVVSAVWGGIIGYGLGRTRVYSGPMPGYPFEHPMEPMPRFEPWSPEAPRPERPDPPRGFEGQAWLGVTFVTIPEGAEITSVIPDSPADQAGVRVGDVITEVNGDDVSQRIPLDEHILRYEPGAFIELTIIRNGRQRFVEARLGIRSLR